MTLKLYHTKCINVAFREGDNLVYEILLGILFETVLLEPAVFAFLAVVYSLKLGNTGYDKDLARKRWNGK